VVGAGPAGLACAHDLAAFGYRPVVYDAASRPGGMMVLGIPDYRLRRDVLDAEIAAILDLGVELRLGVRLGVDVSLARLRKEHAAVFVAVGAMRSRDLDIPGAGLDGVVRAVEFLLNVNQGFRVDLGERVVVVGGGNVALDAARSALRELGEHHHAGQPVSPTADADVTAAATATLDAARAAVRLGAREVTVVALESRSEMPAAEFEIEEAELEGIRILHRRGPRRIVGNGRVAGLETLDVTRVFDPDGRFAPEFAADTERIVDCDSVILAIGQSPDLSWLDPADGIDTTPRGTVAVDERTLATTADGVYAGGDLAFGPRNLIDAIADGRRAAASIHQRLAGPSPQRPQEVIPPGRRALPIVAVPRPRDDWDAVGRVEVPALPSGRRVGAAEVELGYTEAQARTEGARCLQCFDNIVLDAELCILCAGCVDICPMDCLRIVPMDDVEGMDADGPAAALILDEDPCIRCALCVARCPTDALSLGQWAESSTAPTLPLPAMAGSGGGP
jgi:NADPH-dependent glutamate synthase beta subunit-like oxidoreductase